MTRIASAASLLHAALQDIHAGKRDEVDRLPVDAAHDAELRHLLDAERVRAEEDTTRFEALGLNTAGPANLWMKGVLDDAARDVDSTVPGQLLDIALAGAIRKGKAAEAVACDTALALARVLDDDAVIAAVAAVREAAVDADVALLNVIVRLSTMLRQAGQP